MITKTIGSDGDYANIVAAWKAIGDYVALADDYTFTIISDFDESEAWKSNDYRVALNGKTVTIENPNGYTISWLNGTVNYIFACQTAGNITLDSLVFSLAVTNNGIRFLVGGAATTITCKNIKVIGAGVSTATAPFLSVISQGGFSSCVYTVRMLNCIFYNCGIGMKLTCFTSGDNITVENCVAYECNTGIELNSSAGNSITIKNSCAFGCVVADIAIGSGTTTNSFTNCADSDNSIASSGAVLSGNITGITDGDFLSVDPTSANFLKIDSTSDLYKTGTADISAWNTEDAFGNMRPDGAGQVSIGIHEPVVGYVPPGKKILENKQLVGFKLETNPFTPETLVAADYGHHVYDVKVEPGIELLPLRAARADFSKEVSISGRRLCAANWKVDLYAMTDPATPPAYFSMLRACGWKQIVHGTTGVSIRPDSSYNRVPATIEVAYEDESSEPRQLVYKIGGAMGSVKIIGVAGLPVALEFSFLGTLEGITTRPYASRITPTGFDDEVPPALLGATVSFMGYDTCIESFEVSGNEVVDLFTNIFKAHGYDGSRVSGRLLSGKVKIVLNETIDPPTRTPVAWWKGEDDFVDSIQPGLSLVPWSEFLIQRFENGIVNRCFVVNGDDPGHYDSLTIGSIEGGQQAKTNISSFTTWELELYLKILDTDGWFYVFQSYDHFESVDFVAASIDYQGDYLDIYSYDSEDFPLCENLGLVVGEWFKLRLKYTKATHKWEVYINDVLKPFSGTDVMPVNERDYTTFFAGVGWNAPALNVDEIKIFTS